MTSPESPRILVIRRRYLGDIVLLGSVFLNLRRRWPSARIGALVERPYAGILPLNPDVDDVHTLPTRWSEWWGFLRQLRRHRYTHVLDFDNTERTAFVTRMSGASVRVAFDRELIPFRQSWVYTHSARVRNADYDRQPITTTYLALLQVIDVPVTHLTPRLVPRATWRPFGGWWREPEERSWSIPAREAHTVDGQPNGSPRSAIVFKTSWVRRSSSWVALVNVTWHAKFATGASPTWFCSNSPSQPANSPRFSRNST